MLGKINEKRENYMDEDIPQQKESSQDNTSDFSVFLHPSQSGLQIRHPERVQHRRESLHSAIHPNLPLDLHMLAYKR